MPGEPPLFIGKGQHWFVAGENGSGKTFWGQNWMLPQPKRSIVWDTENMEFPDHIWPEVRVRQAIRLATDRLPFRVRIVADAGEKGLSDWDEFTQGLLATGHDALIFVDEYADLSKANWATLEHRRYLKKARKRNLVNVLSTQRPQEIPKTAYTQAIHRVWFALDESDIHYWKPKARFLERMMPEIPFGSFKWLYHQAGQEPVTYKPVPRYPWEKEKQ